jgi:hypothetical protein
VANVVPVRKKNGEILDLSIFRNLNLAYLKITIPFFLAWNMFSANSNRIRDDVYVRQILWLQSGTDI